MSATRNPLQVLDGKIKKSVGSNSLPSIGSNSNYSLSLVISPSSSMAEAKKQLKAAGSSSEHSSAPNEEDNVYADKLPPSLSTISSSASLESSIESINTDNTVDATTLTDEVQPNDNTTKPTVALGTKGKEETFVDATYSSGGSAIELEKPESTDGFNSQEPLPVTEEGSSKTKETTKKIADVARKAAVGVVGGATVGIGLVMIPLPTPFGAVVAASGMAVLGTEFPAAQSVLEKGRDGIVTVLEKSCAENEVLESEQDDDDEEEKYERIPCIDSSGCGSGGCRGSGSGTTSQEVKEEKQRIEGWPNTPTQYIPKDHPMAKQQRRQLQQQQQNASAVSTRLIMETGLGIKRAAKKLGRSALPVIKAIGRQPSATENHDQESINSKQPPPSAATNDHQNDPNPTNATANANHSSTSNNNTTSTTAAAITTLTTMIFAAE